MKILTIPVLLLVSAGSFGQTGSLSIYFDFNKSAIRADARATLDSFFEAEKANLYYYHFDLTGHCDSVGSLEYNSKLSKQRSGAIKNYLRSNGVEKDRFGDITGLGETDPIASNDSEGGRQMNRRVELKYYRIVPQGITRIADQIKDSATKVGTNITLRNINFEGGRHIFLPSSLPALQELLDAM